MRGEETQLIGCLKSGKQDGFFIFPGTHSKHVEVEDGMVKDFKTYMTGEFFELLSQKSILLNSVEENTGELSAGNINAAVLPVPVWAEAIKSLPAVITGIACAWMAVGSV